MPKAKEWYKADYNSEYGEPVKRFTMEDLIKADKDFTEKEENIKQDRRDTLKAGRDIFLRSNEDLWSIEDVNESNKI